jgi:methionine-rich copper-binding protein CopC
MAKERCPLVNYGYSAIPMSRPAAPPFRGTPRASPVAKAESIVPAGAICEPADAGRPRPFCYDASSGRKWKAVHLSALAKFVTLVSWTAALSTGACQQRPAPETTYGRAGKGATIISSTPSDGAAVSRDLEHLELRYSQPVRLTEVVLLGPSGTMPMMVTAAGEQTSYAIPLSGLEPGAHQLKWSATHGDEALNGIVRFRVR